MMEKGKSLFNLKVVLAFAAIYIIWGTTYLAIKIGLEEMPPFMMAALRYLVAGILLIGFCILKKEAVFNRDAFKNMLLGALMLTFGQGVLFWVEQFLPSGLTAVFIATLPVWYIAADHRNWKAYFNSKLTLAGILLGLIGIIILFKDQANAGGAVSGGQKVIASLVVIASCLCWAIGSLYYKYNYTAGSLFCNVGWQLLGGGITCLVIGFISGEHHRFTFDEVSFKTYMAVLYLAVAGSIIAFTASYYLLSVRPPAVVGIYAYVNPVIAVLLGALIAEEQVTIVQVIGMVVILISAYLSNKAKLDV
jgi:drug/metabolite transporter (DMT)-like permease